MGPVSILASPLQGRLLQLHFFRRGNKGSESLSNMSKHIWVKNSSKHETRGKWQNPQKSKILPKVNPKTGQRLIISAVNIPSSIPADFSISIWRSRTIYGILGENGVRGQSAKCRGTMGCGSEQGRSHCPEKKAGRPEVRPFRLWTCYISTAGLWGGPHLLPLGSIHTRDTRCLFTRGMW